MAAFPYLKTGAVAQYPLGSGNAYATQEVVFLNGTRQVFSTSVPLRRWKLELAGLDAAEAESIHQFLEAQNGEPFSFTDPVTGETANKCVVAGEARTGLDVGLRSTSVLAIAEVL